jgi:predicted CXXCH cytochrome family protein
VHVIGSSCTVGLLAGLTLGALSVLSADDRANEPAPGEAPVPQLPPPGPFNHPMGESTKASNLLVGCGLPLFDAEGRRVEKGAIGCGTCHADAERDPAAMVDGKTASAVCAACHQDEAKLSGTAHVMDDGCLACHQPHGSDSPADLWTVGLDEDAEEGSAACLSCHDHPGWGSWPRWKLPDKKEPTADGRMTLVPRAEPMEAHQIECNECHNPHAKAPNSKLLADGPDDDPAKLCLNCHEEGLARLAYTYHSPSRLSPAGQAATLCSPCHVIHGPSERSKAAALVLNIPATAAGVFSTQDLTCLACHALGTGAGQAAVNYVHPAIPMVNRQSPGSSGFYPLINQAGEPGNTGRVGCATCHLPHGREVDLDDLSDQNKGPPQAHLPPAVPLVRRYVEPNVCSDCHRDSALERFLWFHKPQSLPRAPR